MIALVPPPLVTTHLVDDALLTAGFVRTADFPFGSGIREVQYRRGDGRALVLVGAEEGAVVVQLDDVEGPLVEAIARAIEAEELPALMAAVRDAADARAAVRAIGRISVLFYLQDLSPFDEALDLVLDRLTDPHPIVRWAACSAAPSASRKVEAALAAAKDRFPELTAPWEGVREVCQRMEDGTRLLAEEKTPAYVLGLLEQANRAVAGLDATRAASLAKQALAVARVLDSAILRVCAGIIAGYVTVVNGDVDEGLAIARGARAELDTITDASPMWRAEQLGEYVTVLSAAQRWDEAEIACREALAARVAAFGEVSLPVVLSHHQLGLIEIGRGAPAAERAATLDRAAALLAEVIARAPDDAEAHAQRASIGVRRADLTEDPAERVALLSEATEALETAARGGGLRRQHVYMALLAVEQASADGEPRARLSALHDRLTALL